ncbi:MAG TPA: (p)ppGpp synthetase [Verrucomicrobiales bacterium]|nr:(p)ppGpp synthetase [Verrucomicrobiales bacterium]HRJ07907.1 RelA/SpoT domain-containing protein [Prosthecobacter sp.]HRK14563.1 RelA/SpoT domain-containing protein [Prosthecobacter sp.]
MKYSNKQITKAGETLIKDPQGEDLNAVMDVLSYWRLCHERPLNLAWQELQQVVLRHDKDAIFAKRLKRYASIYKKLKRIDNMTLRNMQDIGGCRAIVGNEKKLLRCVRDLKKLEAFKTEAGRYRAKDYLKHPKDSGYRSFHLVGRFPNERGEMRNIEIQLRTRFQHYWATALEIVDLFTGQALKSNQGDPEWTAFFRGVSDLFAVMDDIFGFQQMPDLEKVETFAQRVHRNPDLLISCAQVQERFKTLRIGKKFEAYANSIKVIDNQIGNSPKSGYILLVIDTQLKQINSQIFAKDALSEAAVRYATFEKEAATKPDLVVALVSAASVGGIREAYPNFFADSTMFMMLLHMIMEVNPNPRTWARGLP